MQALYKVVFNRAGLRTTNNCIRTLQASPVKYCFSEVIPPICGIFNGVNKRFVLRWNNGKRRNLPSNNNIFNCCKINLLRHYMFLFIKYWVFLQTQSNYLMPILCIK